METPVFCPYVKNFLAVNPFGKKIIQENFVAAVKSLYNKAIVFCLKLVENDY
jgi:hypothetical protein